MDPVKARGRKNSAASVRRPVNSSFFRAVSGIMAAMQEIELKFQVPAARRAAVDAAVAGPAEGPRMRPQAAYFDTSDHPLAKAGLPPRIFRRGGGGGGKPQG